MMNRRFNEGSFLRQSSMRRHADRRFENPAAVAERRRSFDGTIPQRSVFFLEDGCPLVPLLPRLSEQLHARYNFLSGRPRVCFAYRSSQERAGRFNFSPPRRTRRSFPLATANSFFFPASSRSNTLPAERGVSCSSIFHDSICFLRGARAGEEEETSNHPLRGRAAEARRNRAGTNISETRNGDQLCPARKSPTAPRAVLSSPVVYNRGYFKASRSRSIYVAYRTKALEVPCIRLRTGERSILAISRAQKKC